MKISLSKMGSRSSSKRSSSKSSSNKYRGGYHPDLRKKNREDARNYANFLEKRWKRIGKPDLTP